MVLFLHPKCQALSAFPPIFQSHHYILPFFFPTPLPSPLLLPDISSNFGFIQKKLKWSPYNPSSWKKKIVLFIGYLKWLHIKTSIWNFKLLPWVSRTKWNCELWFTLSFLHRSHVVNVGVCEFQVGDPNLPCSEMRWDKCLQFPPHATWSYLGWRKQRLHFVTDHTLAVGKQF